MMNKFWELPSLIETFLLIFSSYLVFLFLLEFNLFSQNSDRGFFFDYQNLIAGLLAFGAGIFVLTAAKNKINFEKTKILDKKILEKAAICSSILAEFQSIRIAEKNTRPLKF